jgi:hypothetical protein
MPNKKQKQLMREEKRRRATAEKESAELAANQFEEQSMMQLGHEADQRGVAMGFPKMPVKTRKRVKWKDWKPEEINKSVDEIKS